MDVASVKGQTLSDIIRDHAPSLSCVILAAAMTVLMTPHDLLETKLPLGVLPLGTANDFAQTMGIRSTSSVVWRARDGYLRVDYDLNGLRSVAHRRARQGLRDQARSIRFAPGHRRGSLGPRPALRPTRRRKIGGTRAQNRFVLTRRYLDEN